MIAIKVWHDGSVGICYYSANGILERYANLYGTIAQNVARFEAMGYKVAHRDMFLITMVRS